MSFNAQEQFAIIVVLLLVIIGLGAGFLMFGRSGDKDKSEG